MNRNERARICLCIPVYNNPGTIAAVAEACLQDSDLPLLIIDDGSEIPVENLLAEKVHLEARKTGRLKILRRENNEGKGSALQTAFEAALGMGYTHLLTLDGDGQHLTTEIAFLAQAARKEPRAMIIGARRMKPGDTPFRSRLGRALSNAGVKALTGKSPRDSQSGMRVYPLDAMEGLRFASKGYEFEIEILLRLAWKGVPLRPVSIAVHYPPAGERVSHFHVIRDNLNACLLFASAFLWLAASRWESSRIRLPDGKGLR